MANYGERNTIKEIELNKYKEDKLFISRITGLKQEKVELREFYKDKETGEYKPSPKGVRVNVEDGVEILMALIEAFGADVKQDLIMKLEEE